MNYKETIQYLFTRLPMFSRIGAAAYKKDLHNTLALCSFLGNPQHKIKTIHIAGTNGKGSSSHILAAILQEAGFKTGLYTSPHLKDFRERIKINGEWIPEKSVVDFTKKIQPLIEKLEPSFFEITVAMALDYFANEKTDIAVIETGLGGRLDSTNIILPELCLITNIGFDHMQLLGNSLAEIAFEKAGIIKKNIPVIIGNSLPETKPVFIKKALETDSPVFFADDRFTVDTILPGISNLELGISDQTNECKEKFIMDLNGVYQAKNLPAILIVVEQLQKKGYPISKANVNEALKKVKRTTGLHGRWEIVSENPLVILDVAHNEDGIRSVTSQLKDLQANKPLADIYIIIGVVKDKETEKILQLLPKDAFYAFTEASLPRALPKEMLAQIAAALGLNGTIFDSVNSALKHFISIASAQDIILVTGSVFLIGELDTGL
jgi:dihydrofolate synthase/folylpolyglutamate synthase